MFVVQDRVVEPLYVITPVFNPIRFKARPKLYDRFQKHVVDAGAVLYTIEAAYGRRQFAIDHIAPHKEPARAPALGDELLANCNHDDQRRGLHRYIACRTRSEIWLKENLINLAATRLPSDWKYLAWIDCDVHFLRPNWVGECIQQLQHYSFLQMFSHAVDLGPNYEMLPASRHRESFMSAYLAGHQLPTRGYYKKKIADVWSGLAWACTREAWEATGGLIDFAIHGGGDWHMSFALIGQARYGLRRDLHPNYKRRVLAWEARCERHIRRNVGVMDGTVAHGWHGKKADRRYAERHKMLADLQFDPDHDLKYDAQGLYQLVDHGDVRSIKLRDVLRMHARARNEDSIDLI